MIDTSKIRKYISPHEDYAINWFNKEGFDGRVVHQWTTETLFEVNKNGVSDTFKLTAAMQDSRKCNISEYMEQFARSFDLKRQIADLKKQLGRS